MRDDALYAITDGREFVFGDCHPGRRTAIGLLLGQGCEVKMERNSPPRWAGLIYVRKPGGGWACADAPVSQGAIVVTDPAEAWRLMCACDDLDPAWLKNITTRMVAPGKAREEWIAIEHPQTVTGAVALAEAAATMRQAEARVREIYTRLEPFGGGACPPIYWAALTDKQKPGATGRTAPAPLFSSAQSSIIELIGWHPYCDLRNAAADKRLKKLLNLRSGVYGWVDADLEGMWVYDEGRSRGLKTPITRHPNEPSPFVPPGISYAEFDNPWESLMNLDLLGFQAVTLAPDRVVLVASDGKL